MQQDGTLTMIGERVNTLGSRKVKKLLLADDYDGVLEVAVNRSIVVRTCSMCVWP
jgi:5-methyltetrahydrofolate--homocysteine methyltransferase